MLVRGSYNKAVKGKLGIKVYISLFLVVSVIGRELIIIQHYDLHIGLKQLTHGFLHLVGEAGENDFLAVRRGTMEDHLAIRNIKDLCIVQHQDRYGSGIVGF